MASPEQLVVADQMGFDQFVEKRAEVLLPFYKKIFVTFRRSSVSHLDLDLGVPIFPREIMVYFPGGGVVAFRVS